MTINIMMNCHHFKEHLIFKIYGIYIFSTRKEREKMLQKNHHSEIGRVEEIIFSNEQLSRTYCQRLNFATQLINQIFENEY